MGFFNLIFVVLVIDLLTKQSDINLIMSTTVFVKKITTKNQIIQSTSSLSGLVPNYVAKSYPGYKFSKV